MCLIDGLEKIFDTRKVALMDDNLLNQLASEHHVTRTRRTHLQTKQFMLNEALQTCHRHSDRTQQSWYFMTRKVEQMLINNSGSSTASGIVDSTSRS